jgi:mannan endo-1,4-beta-mannosidase
MKNFCPLLLAALLAAGCDTPREAANPRSNAKAEALVQYFHSLEGRKDKRLLSGQFSNFGRGANLTVANDIHDKTGHWPAILGVDYMQGGGLDWAAPNRAAMDYWKAGGLVTVSAHLYNPARTNENGGLRDESVDLNALLATNTETHVRWMRELDQLADGLKELQSTGVVVLWRPFHEMNGNWFWWDGKDPRTFVRLWRQMFDYFTVTKGLDNLLWVYAPNHGANAADYYPGDNYVDLVGLDAYTDFVDPEHILGYPEMARIKKPFGFTEFGPHGPSNPPGDYDYRRFIAGIRRNFPRAVFFMSWNARWSLARNNHTGELLDDPWIINREDLPPRIAGGR